MLDQLGKLTLIAGLVLAALGAAMLLAGKLGLHRLPGDITFGGKHWRVILPLGTCLLLSALLTLALYVIRHLRR